MILSIKPVYALPIMAGTKTIEIRRRFGPSQHRHIGHCEQIDQLAYIYASASIKKMIGTVRIVGIDTLSTDQIWERYSDVAGIDRPDLDAYLADVSFGVVLRLCEPLTYTDPVPLSELRQAYGFTAPQSYVYASADIVTGMSKLAVAGPSS